MSKRSADMRFGVRAAADPNLLEQEDYRRSISPPRVCACRAQAPPPPPSTRPLSLFARLENMTCQGHSLKSTVLHCATAPTQVLHKLLYKGKGFWVSLLREFRAGRGPVSLSYLFVSFLYPGERGGRKETKCHPRRTWRTAYSRLIGVQRVGMV